MAFDIEAVRAQFPSLSQPSATGGVPIFLDNPAGTQVPKSVMDAVVDYYMHMNANSGGMFATSQRNDRMLQQARETVATFLNAPLADEIVFGPNMTTLNFSLSRALAKTLAPGDELVVTRMDHDGNVAPWLRIAEDFGLVVRWVDIVNSNCTLDLDSYEAALSSKTKIVATVHASNAVGTINPIRHLVDMAHAAGALYVLDAVQSAPHISLDVDELGCDFLMCSAYKFYGPHIGILWGKYDLLAKLPAYKVRPSQDIPPWRWETGTPSFETIHGVKAAIEYLASLSPNHDGAPLNRTTLQEAMNAVRVYEQNLFTYLIEGLQSISGITIAGIINPDHYDQRVPTVAFVKEGYTSDEIATYLGQHDIYVWSGDYYALEIMNALGYQQGMVRVGLAHYNTKEEITRLIEVLYQL